MIYEIRLTWQTSGWPPPRRWLIGSEWIWDSEAEGDEGAPMLLVGLRLLGFAVNFTLWRM